MKVFRGSTFKANRAWGAVDIANMGGVTTRLHWTDQHFLTDRIGNIGELRPYFPLWRNISGIIGALRIVIVEQDATSYDVQKIPKGTDGWGAHR